MNRQELEQLKGKLLSSNINIDEHVNKLQYQIGILKEIKQFQIIVIEEIKMARPNIEDIQSCVEEIEELTKKLTQ